MKNDYINWCRTVHALIMREVVTRYGKNNIGILWLAFEPMLFTLAITALWIFSGLNLYSDINIIGFALTGYSSVLLWRNAAGRCLNAVEVNAGLLYHRKVRPLEIFLSRITLEIIGVSTSFFLLSLFLIVTGSVPMPEDVFRLSAGWILLCFYAMGLGLVIGVISEVSETFERAWHVISYVLFPVSGAVFLVDWLPVAIQSWILCLPMVHGVEMVRDGYFGSVFTAHYDAYFLAINGMVLNILGISGSLYLNKVVVPR